MDNGLNRPFTSVQPGMVASHFGTSYLERRRAPPKPVPPPKRVSLRFGFHLHEKEERRQGKGEKRKVKGERWKEKGKRKKEK
jgi:hypothetical protein